MAQRAVYTMKEDLVESLKILGELSAGDPYKEALHKVLVQLSGMACEAATYDGIVRGYVSDE